MPASTGTHCSRCVNHRGLMTDKVGAVLVALASCRAALSPSVDGWEGVSAMGGPVDGERIWLSGKQAGVSACVACRSTAYRHHPNKSLVTSTSSARGFLFAVRDQL